MKRYFLVHDDALPAVEDDVGQWHFIALDGHGPAGALWNVVCLVDAHVPAPDGWIAFPPIFDARTTLAASAVPHERLADLGLTGEETAIEALMAFGAIHPLLGP